MKTTHAIGIAGFLTLLLLAGRDAMAQESSAAEASEPATSDSKASIAPGRTADRALQKNVLRALSRTKGLRVATITVRARDGAVILEGTVPEESQVGLATQSAEKVQGVRSVTNALTLSTF
ncbi:BON domain-containing protein [Paraburkholderia sp. BCC1886]|uniref:BON domain-containing protein n=1 Tax=Paraburkholderia sp. BCC1886 TaxID=2562670 RepID=UPI00118302E5|nr:BON domain-containing protein [Paraburkholderia sp. BCC1886]